MVKVGDFVTVITSSLEEFGINAGQLSYIAGTAFVPKEEDSFDYRIKFLCAFVEGGHIVVDKENHKMFYVDPDHLEPCSEKKQETLTRVAKEDYPPDETEPEQE